MFKNPSPCSPAQPHSPSGILRNTCDVLKKQLEEETVGEGADSPIISSLPILPSPANVQQQIEIMIPYSVLNNLFGHPKTSAQR